MKVVVRHGGGGPGTLSSEKMKFARKEGSRAREKTRERERERDAKARVREKEGKGKQASGRRKETAKPTM